MSDITMCCGTCGGGNVVCDASAEWDPAGQTSSLGDVFDDAWCDDCESDVAIVQRRLLEPAAVAPTA